MANEITVTSSLLVRKNKQQYQSLPASFQATQHGNGGPTPGTVTVSVDGTDIDLSALTTPGLCRVQNLDTVNAVELGVYNPDQSEMYPVMRIEAGESYVFRLSKNLNQEYAGTGTGTTGQLNTFRLQAENAACLVKVEAMEY